MRKGCVFPGVFLILTVVLIRLPPLQAQTTFTISGMVSTPGGRGIDGITIAFDDQEVIEYTITAGGGYYSHTVYQGWSGTVTPNHECYSFQPLSATIGPVIGDTVQDFEATFHTYTISGIVSDGPPMYSGEILLNPIPGVVLTPSTGGSTLTGPDGSYSLTVNCGWSGTVTPMKVGWEFNPSSRIYEESVGENLTDQNYIGTPAPGTEFTISGTITDSVSGAGIDGVTVAFYDGFTLHTETTSGGGHYTYTVPIYWTGLVTPDYLDYIFSPPSASIGPVIANTTQNFVGAPYTPPPPPSYCHASGDGTHDLGIVSVEVHTGSQTSGITAYSAYTESVFTNLAIGSTHPFTLTYRNNKNQAVEVLVATYIDWNGNGEFDDGCSLRCEALILESGQNVVHSGVFSVPVDASAGDTRMRVAVFYDESGYYLRAPACVIGLDGEVEDYTVQVRPTHYIYLPLTLNNHVVAPDLVVQNLTATADDVTVTILNQGNAPVTDAFWVDAYINPHTPPTQVNQTWDRVGSQGISWIVEEDALPLLPGGIITLAVNDAHYVDEYSHVLWPLAEGTAVYAQADSVNIDTTYGGVLESHEISGGTYNNISPQVISTAIAGAPPPPADSGKPTSTLLGDVPARP